MKKLLVVLFWSVISQGISAQVSDTINISNQDLDIHFGTFKTQYYCNEMLIPKNQFKSLLLTHEEAKTEYKKGSNYVNLSYVIGVPSMLLLLIQLSEYQANPPYLEVFIGSIIGTAGGSLLEYIGRQKIKKSIELFNAKHVETTLVLKLNGVGLALNF